MSSDTFDIVSPADTNEELVPKEQRELASQYSNAPVNMGNYITPGEFMRMLIEPEDLVEDKKLNRNLQMGNIDKDTYTVSQQTWHTAKLLGDVPKSQGGFLFNWIGDYLLNNINFQYASSNSIDATARRLTVTRINKNETKDTTAKGGFGSLLNKNNSTQ